MDCVRFYLPTYLPTYNLQPTGPPTCLWSFELFRIQAKSRITKTCDCCFFASQYLQQFVQEDIEGHRPIYRTLVDSTNDLLERCKDMSVTEGVPEIQADVKDIIDRWSEVNQFYLERRRQVSGGEHVVKKYRSLLLPVENEPSRLERRLGECEFEGVDVDVGKKKLETVRVKI